MMLSKRLLHVQASRVLTHVATSDICFRVVSAYLHAVAVVDGGLAHGDLARVPFGVHAQPAVPQLVAEHLLAFAHQ